MREILLIFNLAFIINTINIFDNMDIFPRRLPEFVQKLHDVKDDSNINVGYKSFYKK